MRSNQRAGYFPESAYWVAFGDSVPQYLPLYMRSRWLDLNNLRSAGPGALTLPEHVLFSSGWEWGYWQNDYATLRMSYALPSSWDAALVQMFAPLGDTGTRVVSLVQQLAELQHQALIGQRLAPYLAGRDVSLDLGRTLGIISQPTQAPLDSADALLTQAHDIVARRHASLHSSIAERLVQSDSNATIYQFGYLKQANELCYWERERIQLRNFLKLSTDMEPSCLF